jgi:geranyl-CoA carboxylase beta subunit
MTLFHSTVNTASEEFQRNRADMLESIDTLRDILDRAATLSDRALEKFQRRGQLLPRERLSRVLDPGMPFLEILNMAGFMVDDPDRETSVPGCNTICGIGYIGGVRCMLMVDDSGINAGAMTSLSARKGIRAMEIAREKKLPFVHLVPTCWSTRSRCGWKGARFSPVSRG